MRLTACTLLLLALSSIPARNAEAAWLFTLQQVGPDVVLTGSGTIDLTGSNFFGTSFPEVAFIDPTQMFVGAFDKPYDIYFTDITGPSSIGPGPGANATSGTGDYSGVDFYSGLVYVLVPVNYHSGDPLSGTATFSGKTFASLGVTPGHYEWALPSGDTITLSTVPEPTSMTLLGAGLLVLVGSRWRRPRLESPLAHQGKSTSNQLSPHGRKHP